MHTPASLGPCLLSAAVGQQAAARCGRARKGIYTCLELQRTCGRGWRRFATQCFAAESQERHEAGQQCSKRDNGNAIVQVWVAPARFGTAFLRSHPFCGTQITVGKPSLSPSIQKYCIKSLDADHCFVSKSEAESSRSTTQMGSAALLLPSSRSVLKTLRPVSHHTVYTPPRSPVIRR